MLSKLYLISYNALMVLGWSYLAILILSSGDVLNLGGTLYPRISLVLKIFQTGALLEIIHAAIKIVKSNVVIVACQVYSRIMVLWLILVMFQITQTKLALSLLLFAWTTTEIIRYSFYALNLLGTHSQMVTYLRYTLFIVLYPIGITGELLSMYYALPEGMDIKPKKIYLLLYNFIQFLGWTNILISMIKHIPQNLSRTILLRNRSFLHWIASFVDVQNSIFLWMTLTAWAPTEVIRYGYYTTVLLEKEIEILTKLRYSLFIVLYPLGMIGEYGNAFTCLPTVYKEKTALYLDDHFTSFLSYPLWTHPPSSGVRSVIINPNFTAAMTNVHINPKFTNVHVNPNFTGRALPPVPHLNPEFLLDPSKAASYRESIQRAVEHSTQMSNLRKNEDKSFYLSIPTLSKSWKSFLRRKIELRQRPLKKLDIESLFVSGESLKPRKRRPSCLLHLSKKIGSRKLIRIRSKKEVEKDESSPILVYKVKKPNKII
ncbi:HACD [Lepeophtheirus salmonis]|uniref:Very-long-chain (3R)-3-hydroxyacyl-CoA dehydratase n=1 Tax=Lepeophtheirus salmonis TaxID=72036 RepID=A0A7R8D0G8_LEPSM|nr:HACD [Lepeophtheirus salmonis]CAF2983966.1 HACD [Lepeophtheirus salmonis]